MRRRACRSAIPAACWRLLAKFASPEGALKIIDEHDAGRGLILAVGSPHFDSPSAVDEFLKDVERRCDCEIA